MKKHLGYDKAFIGTVNVNGALNVAVYSKKSMMKILMRCDKMSKADAYEFIDYNFDGAYLGDDTPIILDDTNVELDLLMEEENV